MSPQSYRKPLLDWPSSSKTQGLDEPAIWSLNTGQRIPCFGKCQLTITLVSNIKFIGFKPRLHDLVLAGVVTMLCDVAVVVGGTRTQSMPLVMLTMKKELHGFLFFCILVVLSLLEWCSARAPLSTVLCYAIVLFSHNI